MRPKIKVSKSPQLTKLLFLVGTGINYAQQISQATGKNPSPLVRQLKKLTEQGYLTFEKEPMLNKKVYSVQWDKVITEFLRFIDKTNNEVENYLIQNRLYTSKEELKEYSINSGFNRWGIQEQTFKEEIITNKHLINFFKKVFLSHRELNISLNQLFRYIIDQNTISFIYQRLERTKTLPISSEFKDEKNFIILSEACRFAGMRTRIGNLSKIADEISQEIIRLLEILKR